MARKKSKPDQAKLALQRLVQDEQVQQQLRTGALRLREAWSRASSRPASKAVEDKKIYSKLHDAAISFTSAGRRLGRKPEPPKRRGRLLAVAAIAGGAVIALKKKRGAEGQFSPEPITPPAVVTEPPKTVTPVPAA
jgi:ferric-dicitrate binding protein FerR (iron transport regulator)